ncbi:hypothetical protein pb186bvf_010974 [Paramecium bursaria]
MNKIHQNTDIEQLSCTNDSRKEGSQICIAVSQKKQYWWTAKRIILISIITLLVSGCVGVLLWYFLKDISHNYYQGRINNYRTIGRNCFNQQHDDQNHIEPLCYNQSIDSQIITLKVQPEIIYQALSIVNITFIYDNGTSVYFGGFNFKDSIEIDNQDIKELDDTNLIESFPIFKTEVDPKTNTVQKVYVSNGLSPFVVQSAMQQLMHSNTAIQDPDNLTSITGINNINGAANKPRFQFNQSYFPKGLSVLKNVSKDDIVQRVDGLENTLVSEIKFNHDGEVIASRMNGQQNIFQDPLSNDSSLKLSLMTTTNQETTLISSLDIQEIIDVVNKIIEKQNSSIYDQSNITIAYMTEDQKKDYYSIQNNNTSNRMIQNTISPPPEASSFLYVKDKVLGSATVLGQNIQINLNFYGFRQSDSFIYFSELVLILNGQATVLEQQTQIAKDKKFTNFFRKEYNVKLISFVFPVFGIPVSVDLSSLFVWQYDVYLTVQLPYISTYQKIYGQFALQAKASITTLVAQAGIGVRGSIVTFNLILISNIDAEKRTAQANLQLIYSNDISVFAFVQYWECKTWTDKKCWYEFGKLCCLDIPHMACKYGDPKYLIQDTFFQGGRIISLWDQIIKWKI